MPLPERCCASGFGQLGRWGTASRRARGGWVREGLHGSRRPTVSLWFAGSWRVSGLSRAALDEADACPDRDDAHSGTGRDLLCAVEAESGGHGHDKVEQEQEPEHWRGGEQRLQVVSFRIWHSILTFWLLGLVCQV